MTGDMIAFYNRVNRYGQDNGMELTVIVPGHVTYTMQVQEKHESSPETCHGGVIAGLMDAAIGAAALSLAFTRQDLVATVEFKINYFYPVATGDFLTATAKVIQEGKSLIISEGTIHSKMQDRIVSKAMGTFNAYPLSKKNFNPGT